MSLEYFDTVMSFAVVMLLLSMLITLLVQCVIALSGLRGWNLHFGVIQLLEQIDPALKEHSKSIAKAVLEHPSIAHMPVFVGGRRKATAIRPDELLRILKDLAQCDSQALTKDARKAVVAVVTKAGAPDPADLTNRIGTVMSELTKLFPAQTQLVQDAVNRGLAKTSQLEAQIKSWFDTVMDRTTERFLLYTRWITVILAFALALVADVDSIQLFKQLSSNPEMRARLIQSADATLQKAEVIVADQQHPKPIASAAIRAIENDINNEKGESLITGVPDGLIARKDGRDWLSQKLLEPKLTEALAAYNKRFEEATLNRLKEISASFKDVESSLNTTGIQIASGKSPFSQGWLGLLGVIITGLFLSLGAPFWFNALKQLANLRPAIAGKVEEKAQAKG